MVKYVRNVILSILSIVLMAIGFPILADDTTSLVIKQTSVANLSSGLDAEATFTVQNNTDSNQRAYFISALYETTTNQMLTYNYAIQNVVANGTIDYGVCIPIPEEGTYKIETFAWSNMTDRNLISNVVEVASDIEIEVPDYETALRDTTKFLLTKAPYALSSTGAEWSVFGVARSEADVPDKYYENYQAQLYEAISKELVETSPFDFKITELQRAAIAVTAIGEDATNVSGVDLIDYTWNKAQYFPTLSPEQQELGGRQGLNELVFGLITIDLQQSQAPEDATITRDEIIEKSLEYQKSDGSFSMIKSGDTGEVDITGMTITALAPYYDTNVDVKTAIDKALNFLSKEQQDNGGFGDSSESTAQVIVALSTMGIDAATDTRFIKMGNSTITNLLSYYKGGGQFAHLPDKDADTMGTEQAHYALVAYDRFINDKEDIYDMTNITISKEEKAFISIEARTAGKGDLLSMMEVELEDGDSVADIFMRVAEKNDISFTKVGTEDIYFSEIGGIKEAQFADKSGWTYFVNGKVPSIYSSQYNLKSGDVIRFRYTLTFDDLDAPLVKTLKSEIEKAKAYKEADYTAQSYKALQTVITEASSVANNWMNSGNDTETELIVSESLGKLFDAIKALVPATQTVDYTTALNAAGDYLLSQTPDVLNTVGAEWSVFGLGRSTEEVSDEYYADYKTRLYTKIAEEVADTSNPFSKKITEVQRAVIAITSMGEDATNVDGVNLIDYTWNKAKYFPMLSEEQQKLGGRQGLNELVFGLINIDLRNSEQPTDATITRAQIVDEILKYHNTDGGFSLDLSEETSEVDITAMAITALAPYYDTDTDVKSAIDKAISYLSTVQNATGAFGNTSESTAQVIVALSTLNIDAATDTRFIKDGASPLGDLISYYKDGGQFAHIPDGDKDMMGTEQAYYALVAYDRFINEKNAIYDMTDVEINVPEIKNNVFISVEARTSGDGDILAQTEVELKADDTVFDVFSRTMKAQDIEFQTSGTDTIYVSSIDGITEFDHGSGSGWVYSVNEIFPELGTGEYNTLKNADKIRFRYTITTGHEELKKALVELLKTNISDAEEEYFEANYTAETYATFKKVLSEVKTVATSEENNSTETEIELKVSEAIKKLMTAINGLIEKPNIEAPSDIDDNFANDIALNKDFHKMEIEDTYQIIARRLPEINPGAFDAEQLTHPTYRYKVIEGDSVTVSDQGLVTANKNGVSVIEVTYDEKELDGTMYGAIGESNKGLFVVNVSDVNTGIDITLTNEMDHVIEKTRSYDTFYFLDDSFEYSFGVEAVDADEVIVSVNNELIQERNGVYTAELKNSGNIIKVVATNDVGTEVFAQVVDARKIEINVINVTDGGTVNGEIGVGDKVKVEFKGLTQPISRLATIYNPSFVGEEGYTNEQAGVTTVYTVNDGDKIYSESTQYEFSTENALEFTPNKEGKMKFTLGHIHEGWWGEELGAEKLLDGPLDGNLGANHHEDVFSQLPDFEIDVVAGDYITIESINITNPISEMRLNFSREMQATISPENAYKQPIVWSSSNTDIINFLKSASGETTNRLSAKREGSATITATIEANASIGQEKVTESFDILVLTNDSSAPASETEKANLKKEIATSKIIYDKGNNGKYDASYWNSFAEQYLKTVEFDAETANWQEVNNMAAFLNNSRVMLEIYGVLPETDNVTDITITGMPTNMTVNQKISVTAELTPSTSNDIEIVWSTTDANIVAIDLTSDNDNDSKTAQIIATSQGEATINVKIVADEATDQKEILKTFNITVSARLDTDLPTEAEKQQLEDELTEAKIIYNTGNGGKYTESYWNKFETEYLKATTVSANANSTWKDVTGAYTNLRAARIEMTLFGTVTIDILVLTGADIMPEVLPEIEIPELLPEFEAPEIETPEFEVPEIETPELEVPEIETPEIEVPEIEVPEIEVPEIEVPEIEVPEIEVPEIEVPEIEVPEIEVPEIEVPEIEILETEISEIEMTEIESA